MPVGRRRFVLALAFLSFVLLSTSARAQQGPSHEIWNKTLTPEQLKAALAKLAIVDSTNPLEKLLRDHLQKERPDIDPALRDFAIKQALSDPKFLERAKQFAKEKQVDPGRPPKFSQEDLAKMAKMMPRETDPKKLPAGVKLPPDWKNTPEGNSPTGKKPPDGKFPIDNKTLINPKTGTGDPGTKTDTPPRVNPAAPMNPPGANPRSRRRPKRRKIRYSAPDEPTDPRNNRFKHSRRSGNGTSARSMKRPK